MAISLNNKNPNYYYEKSCVYLRLKQHKLAIENANRAIELNDKSPNYYHVRGNAYLGSGNLKETKANYNKAIELVSQPERSCKLIEDLAKALHSRNHSIEARQFMARARSIVDNDIQDGPTRTRLLDRINIINGRIIEPKIIDYEKSKHFKTSW